MALTRAGTALDFLESADGVYQKTISKKYASEVEVVGADGELLDVVYSGAEETTTESAVSDQMPNLVAGAQTVMRARVEYSNEDVARTTTETIDFGF